MRSTLAAGALLALIGAAPASAVTSTVYWDRADYGFGDGIGLSQTMATAAASAGIPVYDTVALGLVLESNPLPMTDTLSQSFQPGNPASVSQQWTATNNQPDLNNGGQDHTLYVVYAHPDESTLVLDGSTKNINYAPADVGIVLTYGEGGVDWVIFKAPIAGTSDYVYLPAVSLGSLGYADVRDYSLLYSLQNPQVFHGESIDKLGVPSWDLAFVSRPAAPIPEPTSGLLMMMGLLAISRVRRKRA